MILTSRIKLGLIKTRAEFIVDCVTDPHNRAVAQAIIDEIEEIEKEDENEWEVAFGRCD
jgi:hypothetical protein